MTGFDEHGPAYPEDVCGDGILIPKVFGVIAPNARIVHKKRGTVYNMVGDGTIQCDRPLVDYDRVSVYRDDFGKFWVRPIKEMLDGRFVEVAKDYGRFGRPHEQPPEHHYKIAREFYSPIRKLWLNVAVSLISLAVVLAALYFASNVWVDMR